MAIVQETFYIPADIAAGIATGKFRRVGGVVRVAQGKGKGQLVKFLDPVSSEKEASSSALQGIAEFAKANKEILIIAGVAVVVITGGAIIYSAIKKQEPKEMKIVRARLDDYLTAVRKGKVNFLVVDQLIKALDDLKEVGKNKKLHFQLTPEELGTLMSQIAKYTQQLADLNSHSFTDVEQKFVDNPRAEVFDLTEYLKIQRDIIVEATDT